MSVRSFFVCLERLVCTYVCVNDLGVIDRLCLDNSVWCCSSHESYSCYSTVYLHVNWTHSLSLLPLSLSYVGGYPQQ